jgi:uncharacterized protein YbjT (DUF2867 family)
MKAILFGTTGMVGQGVLQECLLSPEVETVLSVSRRTTGRQHPKLREIAHQDFTDFSRIEGVLSGYDACFFCLGVSSIGMSEVDYRRVTYDFTLAAAQTLAKLNPNMTFIYVSGAGTDSTGQGTTMWARVKGQTENALFQLPFKAAYAFRPAYIQPLNGIVPKTAWLRAFYAVVAPLYPVWKALFPKYVTTTTQMGRAMIHVARAGAPKRVLENRDINEVGSDEG